MKMTLTLNLKNTREYMSIDFNERHPSAVNMADKCAAIYPIHAGSPKRKFRPRVMYCLFGVHTD